MSDFGDVPDRSIRLVAGEFTAGLFTYQALEKSRIGRLAMTLRLNNQALTAGGAPSVRSATSISRRRSTSSACTQHMRFRCKGGAASPKLSPLTVQNLVCQRYTPDRFNMLRGRSPELSMEAADASNAIADGARNCCRCCRPCSGLMCRKPHRSGRRSAEQHAGRVFRGAAKCTVVDATAKAYGLQSRQGAVPDVLRAFCCSAGAHSQAVRCLQAGFCGHQRRTLMATAQLQLRYAWRLRTRYAARLPANPRAWTSNSTTT